MKSSAAFLGAVSATRLEALTALCGPVPPLTITFDRLEHWPKPRLLVAATTQLPDDLRRVVDGLWQRLDRLGFSRESRPSLAEDTPRAPPAQNLIKYYVKVIYVRLRQCALS